MINAPACRTWLSVVTSLSLLACASDPAGERGTEPADPMTEEPEAPTVLARVDGVVIDPAGQPVAGKLVTIAGTSITTDAEGRFAFTDVTAPYEVSLTETGASRVVSVTGLTSPTPRLVDMSWLESRKATIQGALAAPTKAGDDMLLGVTTPVSSETFDMYAPSFNSEYARWGGAEQTTASLLALKYTDDGTAARDPISFEALGVATVLVEAGKTTSGISLTAQDPGETMMSGQLVLPADAEWSSVAMFAAAGGSSVGVHRRVGTGTAAAFSGVMPSGVGITAGVSVFTHTAEGDSVRFVRDLPTDIEGLTLTVPAPPHLLSPAINAAVKPGDVVSWSAPGATLFVVEVAQYDAVQKSYPWSSRTLTASPSIAIPDLAPLGLHWVPGRTVRVWIHAYDLPLTIDEAAGFSLDTLLGTVWGNESLTTVDGALAFQPDGYGFTSN